MSDGYQFPDTPWYDLRIQPKGHRLRGRRGDSPSVSAFCECGKKFEGEWEPDIVLQYRDHKEEVPHIEVEATARV